MADDADSGSLPDPIPEVRDEGPAAPIWIRILRKPMAEGMKLPKAGRSTSVWQ